MNLQNFARFARHPHSLTLTLTEGNEGVAEIQNTLTSPHSPYRE